MNLLFLENHFWFCSEVRGREEAVRQSKKIKSDSGWFHQEHWAGSSLHVLFVCLFVDF